MKDAATGRRTSEQKERGGRGGEADCLCLSVYAVEEDISWYPDGHNSRRRQAAGSSFFLCRLASRLCVGRLESARGSARSEEKRKEGELRFYPV